MGSKSLISFLFIIGLISTKVNCQTIEFQNISNPSVNLQFWDYFSDIESVALETTNKSIFNRIKKVQANEEFIVVLSKEVLIFSRNGDFEVKIEQGQGPKECLVPTDISVSGDKLFVLDNYRNLKIYNFKGQYLKSYSIPFRVDNLAALGNNLVLLYSFSAKTPYYLSIYELNNSQILFDYFLSCNGNKWGFSNNFVFSTTKGGVSFLHPFCDTLYHINSDMVLVKRPLDFGKFQLPSDFYFNQNNYTNLLGLNPKSKVSVLTSLHHVNKLLIFRAHINPQVSAIFIQRDSNPTGNCYKPANFFFGNAIDRQVIGDIVGETPNEIIFGIQAVTLLKLFDSDFFKNSKNEDNFYLTTNSFLLEIINRISSNSNPVLFFAKPK